VELKSSQTASARRPAPEPRAGPA